MHITFNSTFNHFPGGFGVQVAHMCNARLCSYKEISFESALRFARQRETESPPASPFRRVIARIRPKVCSRARSRVGMVQP